MRSRPTCVFAGKPRLARYDLEAIRQAVTVEDLLRSTGAETGHRGRTRCPIHGGRNPQSFRYDAWGYCCFACGARGDVIDLAQRLLGLEFPGAAAHCAALGGIAPHVADAAMIRAAIARRAERAAARAAEDDVWHDAWTERLVALREAQADVDLVRALLRNDPAQRDPRTTALLDEIGDPYLREQVAELALDELEVGWRAWRETPAAPTQIAERAAADAGAVDPETRRRASAAWRVFGRPSTAALDRAAHIRVASRVFGVAR
jgi:hypothetical protein